MCSFSLSAFTKMWWWWWWWWRFGKTCLCWNKFKAYEVKMWQRWDISQNILWETCWIKIDLFFFQSKSYSCFILGVFREGGFIYLFIYCDKIKKNSRWCLKMLVIPAIVLLLSHMPNTFTPFTRSASAEETSVEPEMWTRLQGTRVRLFISSFPPSACEATE